MEIVGCKQNAKVVIGYGLSLIGLGPVSFRGCRVSFVCVSLFPCSPDYSVSCNSTTLSLFSSFRLYYMSYWWPLYLGTAHGLLTYVTLSVSMFLSISSSFSS